MEGNPMWNFITNNPIWLVVIAVSVWYIYRRFSNKASDFLKQVATSWKQTKKTKKRHYVGEYFGSRLLQQFSIDMSDRKGRPFKGVVIPVTTWNFIVRPIVGSIGGVITMIVLYLSVGQGGWWIILYFITGAFVFAGLPDDTEEVPEARAAMLTFLGQRLRIYRGEGSYNWTGKLFLLGRSKTVKAEGTDKDGYINIQPFQIKIWNQNNDKVATIEAQARNNASVSTTLTLTEQLWDPMLWLNNEDPVLALAERSRESFRGAIRNFTDNDCAGLKNRLGELMEGYKLVATIMPERNTTGRPFSILKDHGGKMLTEMLKPKTTKKALAKRIEEYRLRVETEANQEQLQECKALSADKKSFAVQVFEVEKALHEVANSLGSETLDAAVGQLRMSDKVREKADQASSEVEQRESQEKSAETISAAAARIGEASKKHGELAVAIAASADDNPNVQVVVTNASTDPFTRAASVIAKGK